MFKTNLKKYFNLFGVVIGFILILSLNLTISKPLISTVKAESSSCDAYKKSKADYDYWRSINSNQTNQTWQNQLDQMKSDCNIQTAQNDQKTVQNSFDPDCTGKESIQAAGFGSTGLAGSTYRVKNCGYQSHSISADIFSGTCSTKTGSCYAPKIRTESATLAPGEFHTFSVSSPSISCGSAQTDIHPQGLPTHGTYGESKADCGGIGRGPEEVNANVSIQKNLISADNQNVGSEIKFNIVIRNTGSTDITKLTFTDEYFSNYLEFVKAEYKGDVLNTTSVERSDNKRILTWTGNPIGKEVLTKDGNNDSVTVTLTFKILQSTKNTSESAIDGNDNCSFVKSIDYKNSGENVSKDMNLKSCAPFHTKENNEVRVNITKDIIGASKVNIGQIIKFRSVITNTSTVDYSNTDFTDNYENASMKITGIKVIKGTRSSSLTDFTNNGSAFISAIQNLKDSEGNALGVLKPGETYDIELSYQAMNSSTSTCDTVITNVKDVNNNVASEQAYKCAAIGVPSAPNTGASFILNFIAPLLTLGTAFTAKKFVY